jgi:hypothetical protein
MKSVAIPGAILFSLIVAALTWALWPGALERGLKARQRGDYAVAMTALRPLADGGNASAQFAVGQMVSAGQGAQQNTVAAIEWFLKAAARQHGAAAVELGDRFARGDGVQSSPAEALQWYRRAAAAGDVNGLRRLTDLATHGSARAKYQLGLLYAGGEGVPLSKTEAARWFREAAARGIPDAMERLLALVSENVAEAAYQLGQMQDRGEGIPADPAKAAHAYTRAGNQDHVLAQARLGELYEQGKGVARNEATAAQWFAKAARQGHPESQYRYGLLLMRGRGAPPNPDQAARWLGEAADSGIAAALPPLRELAAAGQAGAQYKLATVLTQGRLAPPDSRQAFEWLRKAAGQGLALAQFDLAYAYSAGEGTPADPAAAAQWYGAAAAQGFATALPKLAQLAASGEPVAQYHYGRYLVNGGTLPGRSSDQTDDLIHAVLRWYRAWTSNPSADGAALMRKAADTGHADAQFELGRLYLAGKGVPASRDEAAAWFSKAAASGNAAAREAVQQLRPR